MTDTAWLPNEVWVNIASYLDNKDLARFRQICKVTQFVGSHKVILQPLYNRLYALDNTLPADLPQDNTLLTFTEAVLKIHARQKDEIAYLQFYGHMRISEYANIIAQHTSKTLASLEAIDAVLDEINSRIVIGQINHSRDSLSLSEVRITRLPVSLFQREELEYFWKKLVVLWCLGNDLTTLNVKSLTALQIIDCRHNKLSSVDVQGLAALRVLMCSNNPLIELNLTGTNIKGECAKLEKTLLWKQLNAASSTEEQQRIIERLGKEYSYANCLYYAPIHATKTLTSNIFSQVKSYFPSLSSVSSDSSVVEEMDEEYKNNKRKRSDINEEDNNEKPDDFKRMKKG